MTIDDLLTEEQKNAIQIAASFEYIFAVLMPHQSPAADEAEDKKVLETVEFYNQLADIALQTLLLIGDDAKKAGLQYASVKKVYDACTENCIILRDIMTDWLRANGEDQTANDTNGKI